MLAATYLIHTMGELCLSPIGLSMVTKLAAEKETGMAMGGWFLSIAMGQYVAGIIAEGNPRDLRDHSTAPRVRQFFNRRPDEAPANTAEA